MKTNFDHYLAKQLQNPDFARRFATAGKAWDTAIRLNNPKPRTKKKQPTTSEA